MRMPINNFTHVILMERNKFNTTKHEELQYSTLILGQKNSKDFLDFLV